MYPLFLIAGVVVLSLAHKVALIPIRLIWVVVHIEDCKLLSFSWRGISEEECVLSGIP